MRFTYEIEGVIDAETQEDAEALADYIAARAVREFGSYAGRGTGDGVLATCAVAVVSPKKQVLA